MKKLFIVLIALIFIISISAGYTLTKDNFQNDTIDNSQNKTTNSSIDNLKNSTDSNTDDGFSSKNLGDKKDVSTETTGASGSSNPTVSVSNSNQNSNSHESFVQMESNGVQKHNPGGGHMNPEGTWQLSEDDVIAYKQSPEDVRMDVRL